MLILTKFKDFFCANIQIITAPVKEVKIISKNKVRREDPVLTIFCKYGTI